MSAMINNRSTRVSPASTAFGPRTTEGVQVAHRSLQSTCTFPKRPTRNMCPDRFRSTWSPESSI